MYVQRVSIEVKSGKITDEILEDFDLLISFYRGSGQKQGKIESQYIEGNKIICLPFTLEQDSLDAKYNNYYVNKRIEKLEKACQSTLQIQTLGKIFEQYAGACKCEKPAFYILYTNHVTIYSPITCGSCQVSVPLYRLPIYYDYGYQPILSWESNYQACDRLQMNCEVGERWAMNQMQSTQSQLSKQGLTICRKIEELTNIPTYYYLFNYKKYKGGDSILRPCPSCGGEWGLEKPLHDCYDFQCNHCKLLSNLSRNT